MHRLFYRIPKSRGYLGIRGMHKAADGVWADTMERCEIAPAVITVCRLRGFARNPTLKARIVKLRRLTDSERPGTRTDRFTPPATPTGFIGPSALCRLINQVLTGH